VLLKSLKAPGRVIRVNYGNGMADTPH